MRNFWKSLLQAARQWKRDCLNPGWRNRPADWFK